MISTKSRQESIPLYAVVTAALHRGAGHDRGRFDGDGAGRLSGDASLIGATSNYSFRGVLPGHDR